MDVNCPRCKTEYEFDDERVPEAGVTVKCTTCQHVFRVRRKTMAVTTSLNPGEPAPDASPPRALSGGTGAPAREWKVRQTTGNIFNFKELTTLQKWIVERKVSRDDEISLTGESWKRLGDIAELASFFQVVDAALKAAQLEAMQNAIPPAPPLPPMGHLPPPPPPPSDPGVKPKVTDTMREPSFTLGAMSPPRPRASAPRPQLLDEDDFESSSQAKPSGGGSSAKWLGLVLLLIGAGGAAGYYFVEWEPAQRLKAQLLAKQYEVDEKAKADAEARLKADEEIKARAAAAVAAAAADAGPAVVDAGPVAVAAVAAVVDAGPATAEKPTRRDADYFINLADRYRDRERAEAALDAYDKALDLQPKNIEAVTGKGLCYLDMAKPNLAEKVLRQAVNQNPRYAPALMGLAESLRLQQKKDEARAAYQRYLDQFPNGAEAGVARTQIERLK